MSRYAINLRNRAAGDAGVAGGKAAGLNRLARQGFDVPPGFVITTHAFRDFLASIDYGVADNPDGASSPRESQHRAVCSAPLPAPIQKDICSAYARLGGRVAVRSSAAGEDASAASHAGQFETVLDVAGEDALLAAVRACWASLFAPRAATYLTQRQLEANEEMAVVVQRMAPATAAGVAFSADPITGQSCVVIEAAPGLGAAVVGGSVRTDRYVVDGRGVLAEVTPVLPGQAVLGEAEVGALARLVREIATRCRRAPGRRVGMGWRGISRPPGASDHHAA